MKRHAGHLIAKIHHTGTRLLARMLDEAELPQMTPSRGRVMFVLWQEDRLPISELARRASLTKSTMTALLDQLEAAGLVQRVPSDEDRRVVLVERTDKDRSFQERYERLSQTIDAIVYAGFSEQEIDTFESMLRRVLRNLEEGEAHAASGPRPVAPTSGTAQ